jgi:hypothetical protein
MNGIGITLEQMTQHSGVSRNPTLETILSASEARVTLPETYRYFGAETFLPLTAPRL